MSSLRRVLNKKYRVSSEKAGNVLDVIELSFVGDSSFCLWFHYSCFAGGASRTRAATGCHMPGCCFESRSRA